MAGGQERILRGRIKSVQSTKKITKAMELIAASRIVKAQARLAAARPYSERITDVIRNLGTAGAGRGQPLLESRPQIGTVGYLSITSDRGLSGSFSSGVIRQTERLTEVDRAEGRRTKLFVVGKKGIGYFRFRDVAMEESFLGVIDKPTYENAKEIAAAVTPAFESGAVDAVDIVFNQFLSAGSQRLVVRRLLPIDTEALAEAPTGPTADYEFEPSADGILAELLPRYVEARIFAALLDSSASFHAFQQRAMKAASDNADELVKTLSRVMNRARQDTITTEIMEIVSGAEALRQAKRPGEDLLLDVVQYSGLSNPRSSQN
ncbi:MAG: F0F1 ATP synthase subunit gamma [Acidimicrobiia bacterium]|nr:F0F1 ATP synthase subunit gamma [Acidimicrobiia bacterium]